MVRCRQQPARALADRRSVSGGQAKLLERRHRHAQVPTAGFRSAEPVRPACLADLPLEPIDGLRRFDDPRAAQVGDQILNLALRAGQQRVPCHSQQRSPKRRVPERNPASAGGDHSVAPERALEQLARALPANGR